LCVGRSAAAVVAVVVLTLGMSGCAKHNRDDDANAPSAARREVPKRIVSLAPSVTEVLYEIGVGDRVVGVTRYCDYPPEVVGKPVVGGYLDINYEAIVALEPDLAVGIQDNTEALQRLNELGVATLQVDQHDVAGILASILEIGAACGRSERAGEIERRVRGHIERIERATAGVHRPRTLVVVDRVVGSGTVRSVWVAGPTTFYNEILELAGGSNAVESGLTVYPELSVEGLLAVDPDAIIEVTAELDSRGVDTEMVLADWTSVDTLRAVRNGAVHVFDQEWMVIPGPRVGRIIESFARALHPDVEWPADG
jgi:iron complex transport system substrate-binding protein